MFLLHRMLFVFVMSLACLLNLDAMESKEAVSSNKGLVIEKSEFLKWFVQQKIALQSSAALECLELYIFDHAADAKQACSGVQNCLQELIEYGFDVNHVIGDDEDKIPINALCWFIKHAVIAKGRLYEKTPETAQSDFKHYIEEYVTVALRFLLEHRADPECQLTCHGGPENIMVSPLIYACKIFYDAQCDDSFMPILELLASYSSGHHVDLLVQYALSSSDVKENENFLNAIRTLQSIKKIVPETKIFEVSHCSAFSHVSSRQTLSSDASQSSQTSLLSSSSSSSSLSSLSLQETPVEVPLLYIEYKGVSTSERVRSRSVNAMFDTYNVLKGGNERPWSCPTIVSSYSHVVS